MPPETPAAIPADAVIAIDGPAGSGKSTTARALADRLGLLYVDTGAMYRALTWAALDTGVATDDGDGLRALFDGADLRLAPDHRDTRVTWNGRDVSDRIRTPEVEGLVSAVAAHQRVREAMVERQRAFARTTGVVMEGRDIGSVVFPLASAKIYLDASLEARARRRLHQHRRRGNETTLETLLEEVAARDRRDSERTESPLTIPPDAVVVDNSDLTLEEQLDCTEAAVARVIAEQRPRGLSPESPSSNPGWRYHLAYAVFDSCARSMGLEVRGREHVEFDEGKIVACNHISNWDPPMLGSALSGMGHFRAVAKDTLFRGVGGPFFRFLDAIPIKRSLYDAGAFDQAAAFLASGENVVFFPEGTRRVTGEPGPVRNGLGVLMQRTEAPAIPVFVRGTSVAVPGGSSSTPLVVVFAPPVRLRALPTLRDRHSEAEINRLIANLFEEIYREMQARLLAEVPFTDEERERAEQDRERVRRKDARIFRKRSAGDA